MLLTWLLSAGIVVVILMSPVWLQKQYGFAPALTLQANSVATIMLCVGCLLAGFIVDRVGASKTFIVGSLLLACSSWFFYHLTGSHLSLHAKQLHWRLVICEDIISFLIFCKI